MGACCGKGSQPKDPDKSPYAPSSSTDKDKGKTKEGKVDIEKEIGPTVLDKENDKGYEDNVNTEKPTPSVRIQDFDKKNEGKPKEEFDKPPTHTQSKQTTSSSSSDDDEKGKQDSVQTEKIHKQNEHEKTSDKEVKEEENVSTECDHSMNSTTTDEIDTPQVELHIDESNLEFVSEIKYAKDPTEYDIPPKRKEAVLAMPTTLSPKTDTTHENKEIPDPSSIIENVRNKAKAGGFTDLTPTTSVEVSKVTHVTTTTSKITTKTQQSEEQQLPQLKSPTIVSKPKDVNQNDSMAILGALKIIRESGGEATLQKEEVKTTFEEIKSDDDTVSESYVTEVKVEKSTKVITSEGSRIPVSPLRKQATVNEWYSEPPSQESETVENNTYPSSTKTTSFREKTEEDRNSQEREILTPSNTEEEKVDQNGIDQNDSHTTRVSFADNLVVSVSSESSLSDTSPFDDGPFLLQNKKSSILTMLPDFSQANANVLSRYQFCPNTRISMLRTIDQWIDGELPGNGEHPRTMVLKSALGMGKSSVLKYTCSKYGLQLAAHHFFCYNSENLGHNSFRDVLLYLVFTFIETFENYVTCLPSLDKIQQTVLFGSTEDVLETFFYSALSSDYLNHDHERKMIVVLDALDECSISERESILQFVDTFNARLPSWLFLLVSIRDENQLISKLNDVYIADLKNNNENMTDMKRIMKEPLGNFMDRISLDGGLTQLAKKTSGLTLCASLYTRMLQNMDNEKKIALREIDIKFPTGLGGILGQVLTGVKKLLDSERDSKQKYSILLGMLCYSREPVDISLFEATGIKDFEGVVDSLKIILNKSENGLHLIYHRAIAEWLLNEKLSGDFQIDTSLSKTSLAKFCMGWIDSILSQPSSQVETAVLEYALKNSICHFTDAPKQQDSIGKVLCSLKVIDTLLKVEGVTVNDVIRQYFHTHFQLEEAQKQISVDQYLKKYPKVSEQVGTFKNFLSENKVDLMFSPDSLYQLAANYNRNERIQQNARAELGNQPWLEDLSIVPETQGLTRILPGSVCAADVSPDGKTVAIVVKDEQYNVYLSQFHSSNGEEKAPFLDIKSLDGRTGISCQFLPDSTNIFVGSLTSYVNSKGKVVSSGIDLSTIPIKQKFSIECCDISQKYLAVSLTTFPWGGRSVHLSLININNKKTIKTLDVLQYRFGGSANFGIRCCTLSQDEKLIGACIKDSNKNQLKVNIWGIGKWDILHSISVVGDSVTKCHFIDGNGYLMDIRDKSGSSSCVTWHYKSSDETTIVGTLKGVNSSVSTPMKALCASWKRNNSSVQISLWKKGEQVSDETGTQYRLNGVLATDHILLNQSSIIFAEDQMLKIYDINQLESIEVSNPQLSDLYLSDVSFMPRSDTSILANLEGGSDNNQLSVFSFESITDDSIMKELITPRQSLDAIESKVHPNIFQGISKTGQRCYVSSDGHNLILNLGNNVALWNSSEESIVMVPLNNTDNQKSVHLCLSSPKEPIVCIVYEQSPSVINIIDLKTKQEIRKISLEGDGVTTGVTDMTFMPHGGFLVSYHKNAGNKLIVWNTRLGKQLSAESRKLYFCRASISSDRLLVSYSESYSGDLELRNSDAKFSTKLKVPDEWSFRKGELDVDFSPDGTIVIGLETKVGACRVWNAGNGEVLNTLNIGFKGPPSVVGMLNNTHVAFYDDRIQVMDIASGEIVCVTPISQETEDFQGVKQMIISPRGNIIAGCCGDGRPMMWKCHNFTAVKRKTTLQRIKSFSSQ